MDDFPKLTTKDILNHNKTILVSHFKAVELEMCLAMHSYKGQTELISKTSTECIHFDLYHV